MDKMYINKDDRVDPIEKRWERIKSTVINAAKTLLNKKRKNSNKS